MSPFAAVPLTLALAMAMGVASGQDHDHSHTHGHNTASANATAAASHARWTPDAPLMEGMSRVRSALADLEARGNPEPAAVRARAADIDSAVAYMFANCRLATEPDIALHAILARLMAGTKALKATPGDTSPAADMNAALEDYARQFDDPAG